MSYSMSFSKSILVVIFIADKVRQGQYEFLSTSSISKVLNIPKPTLVKILQSLSSDRIIETREGKQGGIRLVRDPEKLTVLDILNSIEKGKPLFYSEFDIAARGKRPDKARKILSSLFLSAEDDMKKRLASLSIASILEDMGK